MATINTAYRTDPVSGLRIFKTAEGLIRANAVAAVVALLLGGFFGLLVALTRWPAVHLLPPDLFYMSLTAHGVLALIVWIIFFEIAVLYFCCTSLLNSRLATPKLAWVAFWLMVGGTAMAAVPILMGQASVMMTSYPPMTASPWFYLGVIIFAVGALVACFIFMATLVIAKEERTYEGSVPLVVFGALTACVIAIFTLVSGAIILVPTYLWRVGLISHIDPLMYRILWWAMGHSSQQINVVTHISLWYLVAALVFGAKPMSEKVSRVAFLLYIGFLQLGSVHHELVDPGLSSAWKIFNTSYAMYLAVLASMIHGLTVPGSMEIAQRRQGYDKGLFEWIRKAPWGNPVFSGTILSVILFGFIGGVTGVVMSVEQINLIIHNTMYLPGHFHGTVVGGTTLAFMAVTYWLIPVIFKRELIMKGLAAWQPYLFGIGVGIFGVAFMGAGVLGIPRRHWDISFAGQALAYDWPGMAYLMMNIGEIGAMLMVLGGVAYVLITVGSILFGKPIPENAKPYPKVPDADVVGGNKHIGAGGFEAPGTFVFAMVFFLTLVLYYFINWKYLSTVWPLT